MHPSRPDVLYMQKHWDVMRSDDAGESWHEVSGAQEPYSRRHRLVPPQGEGSLIPSKPIVSALRARW